MKSTASSEERNARANGNRLQPSAPPMALCVMASIGALALGCAGEIDDSIQIGEPAAEVARTGAALQLGYLANVNLVTYELGGTPMAQASAALRLTNIKPGVPFGSCGITFVSKHYAVTAAHCVDHIPIRGRVTVEEIGLGDYDPNEFISSLVVEGTWPNFAPNGRLTRGYAASRMHGCIVTRRCDPNEGGRQACPIAENADIALVKCTERVKTDYARTTHALAADGWPADVDDQLNMFINVWWFHELYAMPTEDDGSDRWAHYGALAVGQESQNWHYTRDHQLLPLFSFAFDDGTQFQSLGSTHATRNTTTAPACHGTSGSGVFINGLNIFLGPVITAGADSQARGRLCDRMDVVGTQQRLSTYIRGTITNAFVRNSPEVVGDM
jgi:hypothetical protein